MKSQTVSISSIVAAVQLQWNRVSTTKLQILVFALIVGLMLSSPALSVEYVEDFEDDSNPGQPGFASEVFQHSIVPIPGSDHAVWDIGDWGSPPGGNALCLWPALDEITFDLGPGEYVDYAAIEFIDWGGATTFEVVGTLDTFSVQPLSTGWQPADTGGENLGQITMIKLYSYEGGFDNLTINVVPEPTTLFLLGLGAIVLRKRR